MNIENALYKFIISIIIIIEAMESDKTSRLSVQDRLCGSFTKLFYGELGALAKSVEKTKLQN